MDMLRAESAQSQWLRAGLVMGIVSGVIFILFEMIVAAFMGQGAFAPLRMIGAIVLTDRALSETYPLATAALTGTAVHLVLSAIFGAVFGLIASVIPSLRDQRLWLVVGAAIFGLLLWIVNFYLIAPVAFPWFTMANPIVQFLAHVCFYGLPLGLLLAWRLAPSGRRAAL